MMLPRAWRVSITPWRCWGPPAWWVNFLLREMLARGYSVRALARTPAKLDEYSSRITIVQGDARDPVVIEELLRGSDVVISALGPVQADGDANLFINTIVTGNVLQAMAAQDISPLHGRFRCGRGDARG